MSRSQRAVLRLPRVGMEGRRSHPISGRVRWVPRRRGGRWVWRLRVTGVGRWRRAHRGREGGFWDVGGSKELSHAGFVRRMKSRGVVGTCWRGGGGGEEMERRINTFFSNSSSYNKWTRRLVDTHRLFDNGRCHTQSGAPDSTALTPETDAVRAA